MIEVVLLCYAFLAIASGLIAKPIACNAFTLNLNIRHGGQSLPKGAQHLASISGTLGDHSGLDNVHLYSLRWTPDEDISRPVRSLWRWKDSNLGSGQDYFVPKVSTIGSLQEYIMKNTPSIEECVVLSNCARLEVLCVTNHVENAGNNTLLGISRCFAAQVSSSLSKPQIVAMLASHLDVPEISIDENASVDSSVSDDAIEINRHWIHFRGEAVMRHLCLVAAGMACRPRRPDREVPFRPYSSRDAHVLLQLKRTKDAAAGKRVNQLIEYALRAGKAVRTVELVPELQLLQNYGAGDSKYSLEPPKHLWQEVAQSAVERVINPLVDELVKSIQAEKSACSISRLRSRAESIARNREELKIIRTQLHQPTMMLRRGDSTIDEEVVILNIKRELAATRMSGTR